MILSDRDIHNAINRGIFLVNPFNPEDLQPASIDLHLSSDIKKLDGECFDISNEPYVLKAHEFILGSTIESVNIPIDLVGHVDGRSSIGRLGLMVHVTAGYIDSGYTGNITLELYNVSDKDILLNEGDSVCQIIFEQLSSPCLRPYGSAGLNSKYQGSEGTVRSKL